MANTTRLEKAYQKQSTLLTELAQPFSTGKTSSRVKHVSERVTTGEAVLQSLKSQIPLMRGSLRPDVLNITDIPTDIGTIHCVNVWSGRYLLPTEFIIVNNGKIPYPLFLKEYTFGYGFWAKDKEAEKEADPFSSYLNPIEYLYNPGKKKERYSQVVDASIWKHESGAGTIKLNWGMQLVPFNEQYIYIFKYPVQAIGKDKYGIRKFYQLAKALKNAIPDYQYDGPSGEIELIWSTFSIMAVPELMEEEDSNKKDTNDDQIQEVSKVADEVVLESTQDNAAENDEYEFVAIAKRRLATGEITLSEFNQIIEALK